MSSPVDRRSYHDYVQSVTDKPGGLLSPGEAMKKLMDRKKTSWSAPVPACALRYMLAGASAGLLSLLVVGSIVVATLTG